MLLLSRQYNVSCWTLSLLTDHAFSIGHKNRFRFVMGSVAYTLCSNLTYNSYSLSVFCQLVKIFALLDDCVGRLSIKVRDLLYTTNKVQLMGVVCWKLVERSSLCCWLLHSLLEKQHFQWWPVSCTHGLRRWVPTCKELLLFLFSLTAEKSPSLTEKNLT